MARCDPPESGEAPRERSRRRALLRRAGIIVWSLFGVIGFGTVLEEVSTRQAEAPAQPNPAPPQPNQGQAWYEGGTLHQATVGAWLRATKRDRIATVAELVAIMTSGSVNDDAKLYIVALVTCMNQAAENWPDDSRVTELFVLCVSQ